MTQFEKLRIEDLQKIELLKKKYDLSNEKDLLELYSALQSGQIVFQTKEGNDFDDMVYSMVQDYKSKTRNKSDNKTDNKIRSKSDHKPEKKIINKSGNNQEEIIASKRQVETEQDEIKKDEKGKTLNTSKRDRSVLVLTKQELIIRRVVMTLLFLTALICLSYFAIYCYDAWRVDVENKRLARIKENTQMNDMYQDETIEVSQGDEVKTFRVLDQYKSLYNSNKTLIGWIKIADTIIDYPVMQTGDNQYYLEHNSNLQEDRNGAIFLDTNCDIKNPGSNYIIYGHNMRSGKMFGSLEKYEKEDYYKKHKYIQFDTIYEEGTYEVMYVFRSKVYKQEEIVFKYYQFYDANSEEEFQSYMNEMSELSFYDTGVTASLGDHLLTLSTCDYVEKDGRFVVVAKQIY